MGDAVFMRLHKAFDCMLLDLLIPKTEVVSVKILIFWYPYLKIWKEAVNINKKHCVFHILLSLKVLLKSISPQSFFNTIYPILSKMHKSFTVHMKIRGHNVSVIK